MSDFEDILSKSLDAARGRPTLGEARLRHLAERLHSLGARCLFEFLKHQWHQPASSFAENLEHFAGIDLAHLQATGGDKFPPRLAVISNDPFDNGDAA